MRIVFMGTPDIAAACLRALLDAGREVVCVYTKPDTPKNRGMKLSVSEVKAVALEAGLPVRQPVTLREEAEALRALKPDLIAVVAYGMLLPQAILDIPPLGCVNIHASLLPALRGSAPVQWAVLNGLPETGVTSMYMAAGLDAGDMIAVKRTPVGPDETAGELFDRMTPLAAELLVETVGLIESGNAARTPQDPALVTWAPRLDKSMAPIDWEKTPRELCNHVRGMHPWPVATAELDGTRFRVHRVSLPERRTEQLPGTVLRVTKEGLEVSCGGGGVVCIRELQAENGRRMNAPDYFRGHPIRCAEG